MEQATITCPDCHEQITILVRDGQPYPRQVPHCYRCSSCETVKRTRGGEITPRRDGDGWFFICHDCKSAGFDS